MTSVAFHPQAQIELVEASEFYEARSDGLGARFLDEVDRGLANIEDVPNRWPLQAATVRRYLLPAFPYGLLYIEDDERIVVVAVMHLHRKPGYWRDRVR